MAAEASMLPPLSSAQDVRIEQHDAIRERIAVAMQRKRESRSRTFDTRLPLSWFRVFRAAFSYVLLFSDVPRSGIGVRRLEPLSTVVEPDKIQIFGPWAYSIVQLHKNETETAEAPSVKVWPYKFDTTSIGWRAFAEVLELNAFPDCVFYRSECPSKTLPSAVVFRMIDALSTALAHQHRRHGDLWPAVMALRSTSSFYDKFHHFVLPRLFMNPSLRTHQAFYYPPQMLTRSDFRICATQSATDPLPYFCEQAWTNFKRSCAPGNTACQSIGYVSQHILQRLRGLQTQYPDALVDLTILENFEVANTIRGGVCYVGRQNVDISTILRVRRCVGSARTSGALSTDDCETIFVHDHRYEAVSIMTDVEQWYTIVASLRAVGQGYFYVRVLALLLSCYATRAAEEKYKDASLWIRCRAALLLFIRVPSQCIIHGSTFPIMCYVCAHFIDAPFTYEYVGDQLSTANGLFTISVWDFCLIAAVQMRSLWLLVLFAQCVMAQLTRHLDPDWSPARGIFGVRGIVVSILASLTTFGQFRSISFRNTAIISIHELSQPSTVAQVIDHHTMQRRGTRAVILEGMLIDVKLIMCILALAVAFVVLQSPGRTPVPYSAGVLWPITAACTQWSGSIFSDAGAAGQTLVAKGLTRMSFRATGLHSSTRRSFVRGTSPASISPLQDSRSSSKRPSVTRKALIAMTNQETAPATSPQWSTWPQTGEARDTLRFLQLHMESVSARHPDVDAIIALFNLVMMSDPLVFCALKLIGHGKPLAFYETKASAASSSSSTPDQIIVVLPPVITDKCFLSDELELLLQVNSADLAWSDLIHCG